ncbi:MAG: hypothetical protein AB1324_08140 [Candidatus Micrarchaeota archaeon]
MAMLNMAAFRKKEAYIRQIAALLRRRKFMQAYRLSGEFAAAFPSELASRYLLAKSAFWAGKYREAAQEGRKAFNLARGSDAVPCAIVEASALFMLGEYDEGLSLLSKLDSHGFAEVESLRFAFAVAKGDEKGAVAMLDRIYRLNLKAAEKLLGSLLGFRRNR